MCGWAVQDVKRESRARKSEVYFGPVARILICSHPRLYSDRVDEEPGLSLHSATP